MVYRIAGAAALALSVLLPAQPCFAGEEEPIVWAAENHSLLGTRKVTFYPALPTGSDADQPEAIRVALDVIQNALRDSGIAVVDAKGEQGLGDVGIQLQLVHYTPGSVGGRWIGMGGGAAMCIIRAHVLDGATGVQVGDIVVAEQVGSGGLFSIGAEKHVLNSAALTTAKELAKLFGVPLSSPEEAGQ